MDIPLTLRLKWQNENPAPAFMKDSDKFPESLPRYFIKKFTKKNARVFDPFLGFGTTAFVAEALGRVPYGLEHDEQRHAWSAGQLENWMNIKCADAMSMDKAGLPKMDFCITSPPYMPRHHKWNPLFGGDPDKEGYNCYLQHMGFIFKKLSGLVRRNAYVIIHVDNVKKGKYYTPLVRDMSLEIEKSMRLKAEIIVNWENPPPEYPHTHCLVFKNA